MFDVDKYDFFENILELLWGYWGYNISKSCSSVWPRQIFGS